MKSSQLLTVLLILTLVVQISSSCKKDKSDPAPPPPTPVLSSTKVITTFAFKQANNVDFIEKDIYGTIKDDTIKVVLPVETDRRTLKPMITIDGVSLSPASDVVQDFSSPVQYSVKAVDGTSKKYTVVVKYRPTVFIGSMEGMLYALDGKTGDELWKASVPEATSSPVAGNGLVFITGKDSLHAFDARNGTAKWRFLLGQKYNYNNFRPTPAFIEGIVYIGSEVGKLYALEAKTGTVKWTFSSAEPRCFASPPCLDNNILYVGSQDSAMYAFNAATGTLIWRLPTQGLILSGAVCYNGIVYFHSTDGMLHAVHANTGGIIWERLIGDFFSSVTVSKGLVYITQSNHIWVFDALTGNPKWNVLYAPMNLSHNERSSLLIKNDILYIGSLNSYVYAFNSNDGSRVWTNNTYGYIYSSPSLSGGIIYIGSDDGSFYAFDADNGNLKWRKLTSNAVRSTACVIDENGIKHYGGNSERK